VSQKGTLPHPASIHPGQIAERKADNSDTHHNDKNREPRRQAREELLAFLSKICYCHWITQ
jgi:hypothetical protein